MRRPYVASTAEDVTGAFFRSADRFLDVPATWKTLMTAELEHADQPL
jgi:hypothetical protein